MDIRDMATTETLEADPDERLAELRSAFEEEDAHAVLVTDGDEVRGVVTPREVMKSHADDDTALEKVAKPVPELERDENVRRAARMLVENETKVAPVVAGDDLWGGVSADDILDAVIEHLDVLSVKEICTNDVVTIREEDSLGEAINKFREHAISRLPVVDERGRLAGILTSDDVIEFVVREAHDMSGTGDRGGDAPDLIELPVSNMMDRPAETTTLEAPVSEAVDLMLQKDVDGLVVTPEYDERIAGVITKTDVLRALSYTQAEQLDVQVTNIDVLETLTREEIRDRIEEVAGKDRELRVLHAHVRFQEHEEGMRGRSLVHCQIRMRTDEDQLMGTGEGYGAEAAFSIAIDKLERNLLERKGRESDEKYRGQLLRSLQEL